MKAVTSYVLGMFILVIHSSAQAVPGMAWTSRNLNVSWQACRTIAGQAIRKVTGGNETVTWLNPYSYLIMGFTPSTGISIYCFPDPSRKICQVNPAATLAVTASSDNGVPVQLRDSIMNAVGNPSDTCWP